ncbi:uncharacterized protein [Antedon mediterranea]|uniref:uncharacterized protein n=1 Tax=Antedon mediterranea TaxID=105859 RepID=UPI003AF746D4
MSSSKKHKKKRRRTGKVSPSGDDALLSHMELGDFGSDTAMKKLNNMERSKLARDGAKMSTADTVTVIKNVKKGVEKFKVMRTSRRRCIIGSPSKGIRGLDGIVNEDMKPNPRNRYLISYFSKLAESSDVSEEIDLDYVDQMLSSGASVNCIDRYGQTILHEVAREWETDVAQFLLERGADVNCKDCFGRTPLHVAAAVDYSEMVNFLIENGADIESKTKEELQTPLHYAARNDACESLKMLHKLGADINPRDYKDRTPLQVAAELDRSETALVLLELGAKACDVDKSGLTAMILMICKMPTVAIEALNNFHRRDRANRKQYYDIHLLEPIKETDREPKSRSVLQVVVEYNQLEVIKHPVILRLIDIKWQLCGRFGVLKQVIWNIFIILLWTILAVTMKSPITYDFSKAIDIFQFSIMILATICTFVQIFLEIREYMQSKKNFKKWQEWRVGELKKDLKFCHPRWPQEKSYLECEIDFVESKGPSYFSEFWNYLDWFVYVLLLAVSICHLTAWLIKSDVLSDVTIRIFAVTIIFVWCRFMKVARAFKAIGPFIVMLGHITKDCARFLFLYMEFYIPYLCAFWMIFGGTDKGTEVTGMTTFDDLAFSLFRITLVDDYDYDGMKEIDKFMANILLGSFLAISALVGINLFIALLSDTFQRVYDNAFSNAIMQRASIMQGIEEGLSHSKKQSVRAYVHQHCSPETLFYDDDTVTEGGDELKKVTFQIKDDFDQFREHYHGVDEDSKEVIASMKSEIKKLKDKQSIAVSEITSELHLLKQLVQQLIDRPGQPGGGGGGSSGGYNLLSRSYQPSGQVTPINSQMLPHRATQLPSLTLENENKLYMQPRFQGVQNPVQSSPRNIRSNDFEEDVLLNKSIDQRRILNLPVLPGATDISAREQLLQASSKERLSLYREQRKKTFKKRKEQENYLELKQKGKGGGGLLDISSSQQPAERALSPLQHSLIISDDEQSLLNRLKFRSTVTPQPLGNNSLEIASNIESNTTDNNEPVTVEVKQGSAIDVTDSVARPASKASSDQSYDSSSLTLVSSSVSEYDEEGGGNTDNTADSESQHSIPVEVVKDSKAADASTDPKC